MLPFYGAFCPHSDPSARSSAKRGLTSLPCSGAATEMHAPACVLHAPAWDLACCCINQSKTFFLSLTFSFSSGCSSYPLLINPSKTYLHQKNSAHSSSKYPCFSHHNTPFFDKFFALNITQMPNSPFYTYPHQA